MSRLLTIALASLIIASSAYAQASQSAYRPTHWDPLGRALDEFKDTDGWIKEKTDLYKRWENEGKLYVIDADSPSPRVYVFMADINRVIRGLVWLYRGALDEGLLPDDEQMKLAREVYAKLSTAMAPYGYWFPRGITDAPLPQIEEQNLLNGRDLAFKAMAFAKAGNTGIAAEYFAQGDKELSDLAEESKQDEDLGKKHTTWKIAEHAYFKAALKEIERLKALAEPEMTKVKNAKDQAKPTSKTKRRSSRTFRSRRRRTGRSWRPCTRTPRTRSRTSAAR